MRGGNRWPDLLIPTAAVAVFSIIRHYYHHWAVAVVAGALVVVGAQGVRQLRARRWVGKGRSNKTAPPQEAVLVYLDGSRLPTKAYREHDLDTLETELQRVIVARDLGEYDGNELRATGTVLFMYGADCEHLFAGVEATLRGNPLCRNARVVLRPGPRGTPSREVRLG